MIQVLQTWLEAAVHGSKCVRIDRIAAPWIVQAVALIAYYRFTVMESRHQNHEEEDEDRRETISSHHHDHRTMCFNESRCQSVTSAASTPGA